MKILDASDKCLSYEIYSYFLNTRTNHLKLLENANNKKIYLRKLHQSIFKIFSLFGILN